MKIKHDHKSQIKICSKCKKHKPRTTGHFPKASKNKDKLAYICKVCKKELDQISRSNSPQYKVYIKSPSFVYSQLRHQAKKRNITFKLNKDYYINNLANKPCFYCGSQNTNHQIDRYNNTIGYTHKNSVACCEMCNKMKQQHTPNDFFKHCKKIIDHNI